MSIRMSISLVISMMVAAVLFGIGVTTVLSVPTLSENAMLLIPLVIVVSFVLTPILSWYLAPTLRAKYQRRVEMDRQLADAHKI